MKALIGVRFVHNVLARSAGDNEAVRPDVQHSRDVPGGSDGFFRGNPCLYAGRIETVDEVFGREIADRCHAGGCHDSAPDAANGSLDETYSGVHRGKHICKTVTGSVVDMKAKFKVRVKL